MIKNGRFSVSNRYLFQIKELMKLKQIIREASKPYFDTTNYRTSNGREPKPNQSGIWAFDIAGETHVTPKSMTYREAQQWATAIAAKSNVQRIRTLA